MKIRSFIVALSLSLCLNASADALSDALALFDAGNYNGAAALVREELPSLKGAALAKANLLLGQCEYELGDYDAAREHLNAAKAKGQADAALYLGRLDYLNYDFEGASNNYAAYRTMLKREKREADENLEKEEQQLATAESFLDRVEKIAIIDSINVPRDQFFKTYRLPASAGSLNPASVLPFVDRRGLDAVVFVNEDGDRMIWSETDSIGNLHLMETMRLTDGSWHEPTPVGDSLSEGADADYPFMMADGITLYFASDGEGSIGGYDIFVATRDPATGEFMQPQNMGMPYNSPADDYMLAIDELNNVGWWATERNADADHVTVYVFVPNELRRNYDAESDEIVSFARIDNFKATQEDKDYTRLLEEIAAINPAERPRKADFHFPMKGGEAYTTLGDFKSASARELMDTYLKAEAKSKKADAALRELRMKYAQGDHSLGQQIARLEKEAEKRISELRKLRSDIYRAELGR